MVEITSKSKNHVINHILFVSGVDVSKLTITYTGNLIICSTGYLTITFLDFCKADLDNIIYKYKEFISIPSSDGKINILVDMNPDDEFIFFDGEFFHINANILPLSFILLTCYEEYLDDTIRDVHGRLLYLNSKLRKYNLIDTPIIDEYASIIRSYLSKNEIELHHCVSKITLTHDIDFISIKDLFGLLLRRFFMLIKNREYRLLVKLFFRVLVSILFPNKDRVLNAIFELNFLSASLNLRSINFVMFSSKTKFDSGYTLNSFRGRILKEFINSYKTICGLHPSYYSSTDSEILKNEIHLAKDFGINMFSRQHYLKFIYPDTFLILNDLCIQEDYSLGYADMEGFRCGTCHSFKFFDLLSDMQLSLNMNSLIIMDVTLRDYRKLSANEALDTIQNKYDRVRAVGGNLIILWHNTELLVDYEFYHNVYLAFLKRI